MITLLLALLACGHAPPAAPPAPPPNAPTLTATTPGPAVVAPPDAPPPAGPVGRAPAPTPLAADEAAAAYARCHDRVELPESAGECTTDADCGRAGCSSEVCLPTNKIQDIMTTCEADPCFRVLSACGCHDGMCQWTLAAAAPPALRPPPIPLPTKDTPQ